jgi:hypothetical protein
LFYILIGSEIPYKFTNPNPPLNGQIGVPSIVDEILKKKQNGFFIECGAYDGESLTNTLFFEKVKNETNLQCRAYTCGVLKGANYINLLEVVLFLVNFHGIIN